MTSKIEMLARMNEFELMHEFNLCMNEFMNTAKQIALPSANIGRGVICVQSSERVCLFLYL